MLHSSPVRPVVWSAALSKNSFDFWLACQKSLATAQLVLHGWDPRCVERWLNSMLVLISFLNQIRNFSLFWPNKLRKLWTFSLKAKLHKLMTLSILPEYEPKNVRIYALWHITGQKSLQYWVHILGETMTS